MKTLNNILLALSLIVLLLFISGEQGCDMGGQGNAQTTGIDFSLLSRDGMLSSGQILQQKQTFHVGIGIQNYDLQSHNMEVCVRDDVPSQYGGIKEDGDCQSVAIQQAEKKEVTTGSGFTSTSEQIQPATREIFFPEDSYYSYSGLPDLNENYKGKLFVSVRYPEVTRATATVTIPSQEQPVITSDPAPIGISLSKSNWPEGSIERINFDITLKKQQNADISLQDFSESSANKSYFNAKLDDKQLDCTIAENPITSNIIDFKDGMVIRCTTTIDNTNTQSHPFSIMMMYGVSINKEFTLNVQTKAPGAGGGGSSGAG